MTEIRIGKAVVESLKHAKPAYRLSVIFAGQEVEMYNNGGVSETFRALLEHGEAFGRVTIDPDFIRFDYDRLTLSNYLLVAKGINDIAGSLSEMVVVNVKGAI